MMTLILIVVFSLVFGYFSTQNTELVTIHFGEYSTPGIPVYLVILVSIALGLLITTAVSMFKMLSASSKINQKDSELKKTKEEVVELTRQVHKLELEDTRLKTEMGTGGVDEDAI